MTVRGQKFNKGEWGELYVFLRLLGEGKLYVADKDLKRTNAFLEVFNIIREEDSGRTIEYSRLAGHKVVEVREDGENPDTFDVDDFIQNADELYDFLTNKARGKAFAIPDKIADFIDCLRITKIKASSKKSKLGFGGKSDIVMVVRDPLLAQSVTMGFSIKSKFGQSPTLFNATKKSRFRYKLLGMNDKSMNVFNSFFDGKGKREWLKCADYLKQEKITPVFSNITSINYRNNLSLIRDRMPEILAWLVREGMINVYPATSIVDLTTRMSDADPLNVGPLSSSLYEKAVKDYLYAAFSGMTASVAWNGVSQVNGGYIEVKNDGQVICYNAYDIELFKNYLFSETKLEYVDRKKFDWSIVEKERNDYILPINFSVRFK